MSVVNQMLKDLDKRQQQHEFPPLAQANIPAQSGRSGWRLLVIGIALGALLFGAGWWLLEQVNNRSSSLPALITIAETAPNTQTVPAVANDALATDADNIAATESAAPSVTADNADATAEIAADTAAEPVFAAAPQAPAELPSTTDAIASSDADPQSTTTEHQATDVAATAVLTNSAAADVAEPSVAPEPTSSTAKAPATGEISSDNEPTTVAATPAAKSSSHTKQQLQITSVELTPAQLAQKQLQQATAALEQGDTAEAIGLLRQALQHDAGLHDARRQLAALYFAAGNLSDAEAILQLGVQRFPQNEEFWLLLARVQLAGSQWSAADSSLMNISDTSALAPEKWLAKIQIAQQAQQWSSVQQGYEQLLRIEPSNSRWHFGLAHALDVQGQYAAAVSEYQQALDLTGLSVDARAYIEQRLVQIGDLR
ncbi:tetratricopeptide repeat protein [Shewanella sp. C32]|uniref:Tetratricopeptide repeat protein n=1 Tax=Shewanella electrica TaxID=515560 RepID=A0ABT2FJ58_9GAMM|nr:tetratricopeptide repeat protein [Shewanella electrica]MCH1924123.1 tetratricopeptide repeat protein [Shewanella electrica]MCS4556026.1 tetratricopeptide repeat protein [Shewanella electrica]